MDNLKKLVKEKLCKKGEAYRKRRMAAGEKSSAYLSGRAVKVCKGQMSGKKKKTNENKLISPSKVIALNDKRAEAVTAAIVKEFGIKEELRLKGVIRTALSDFMFDDINESINEAEFSKGEKDKVKDMIKSLKKSSKGHAGQAKYLTKLVKEDEESNNRVPGAALILPRGKEVILQAEEQDYKRGLLVELTNEGGYKIKYWYGDDIKVYPAEVEVDGESIKKDAKVVDILFHPELKENVAPNHNGKSAPYGSGYKELNVDKMAESLRDWFKKEDWVRINTSGNISGDCGTMKKGKATTRCLPKKKAQSMTKAERKATVAKKVRGSKKGKQFVSVNESIHPYENKGNIRTFSKDVDPTSLVWHSDKEDRLIEVLEGEGWKLQLDNKLPLLLSKGDRIFINEGEIHRVHKGITDLKIKING